MKKIFTLLSFVSLITFSYAQVQRKVLVEEFTNASCGPCFSQNAGFNALMNANPGKVTILKYQCSVPTTDVMYNQNPTEVNSRMSYYSITAAPYAYVDGNVYQVVAGNLNQNKIDSAYMIQSPMALTLNHTFNATHDTIFISAKVKAAQSYLDTMSLKLKIAITERQIVFGTAPGSSGQTIFEHVMRKMVPNVNGSALPSFWNNGDSVMINLSVAVPSYIYNINEIGVVAFLQDASSTLQNVLQSEYSAPQIVTAPNTDFNFSVSCVGQTSHFTDISTNSPTSWFWDFGDGGTSTLQNPPHAFSALGTYNVMLIATNGIGSDTIIKSVSVNPSAGLPLTADFESIIFPPSGWSIDNADLSTTWVRNTSVSGFGNSTACMSIDNFNYNGIGKADGLITPPFTMTGMSNASLTFNVAYARYDATYSDTLSVYSSVDCGNTWTQLYLKSGTALATAPDNTASFVPTAAQWRAETIDLSALVGNNSVMIKFQNNNDYSNVIYIDDINIDGTNPALPPVANFVANQTNINVGNSVNFTDLSTQSPTSWLWSFPGGTPSSSTQQNPTITYNTAGTYNVSLIVTNANGGDSLGMGGYIVVTPNLCQTPKTEIATSGNVFTALLSQSTCLTYNSALNLTMFTHRKCVSVAGNSGYVQSTISTDGGATWDSSLVVYNDNADVGRYPSGVIYNPPGNTLLNQAYTVTCGPILNAGTSVWLGNFFASSKFDGSNSNIQKVLLADTISGEVFQNMARVNMQSTSNGKFFILGDANRVDVNNIVTGYRAVVNKGVWNGVTNAVDWTRTSLRPSLVVYNGLPQGNTSTIMTWADDGINGYVGFLGRDSITDLLSYQPILYKTTNGGVTWTQMPIFDFTTIPEIDTVTIHTSSNAAIKRINFNDYKDATIDVNGNLHLLCSVATAFSTQADSIGFSYSNSNKLFDIYQESGVWKALMVDNYVMQQSTTANDPYAGSITHNDRAQISKTDNGNKLFYTWVDSDSTSYVENLGPHIFAKGFDVANQLVTPKVDFSAQCNTDNFFMFAADRVMISGANYQIPVTTSSSVNSTTPAHHKFVGGIQFNDSDFGPMPGAVVAPVADFSANITNTCDTGIVNFTDLSTNTPTNWKWTVSPSAGVVISNDTIQNPTIYFTAQGSFDVQLIATNAGGSDTIVKTSYITNTLPFTVNLGADQSVCPGTSVVFDAANPGASYVWSNGATSQTINVNVPSVYTVMVSNGACTASDTVVLNSLIQPTVIAGASSTNICAGETITLNVTGAVSYLWNNNQTAASYDVSLFSTNTFSVIGTGVSGCTDTAFVTINVNQTPSLFTGNVFFYNTGTPVNITSGKVYIYNADSVGLIGATDSATIGAGGNFSIPGVYYGNYKILVEPNKIAYPFLTTTYDHLAYIWENATPSLVVCADTVFKSIELDSISPPAGGLNIGGHIFADSTFTGKTTAQGDPIPGVDVALEQNPGSIMLATSTTDATGAYQFSNIPPTPAGASYIIYANIPGFGTDSSYVVHVNSSQTNYDYIVGDSTIYIDSVLSATYNSVRHIDKINESTGFKIYPNPYKGSTSIAFELKEKSVVQLEIYNALGERITVLENTTKESGVYRYSFSAKSLGYSSGIYFAKLRINNSLSVAKLIEVE